MPSATATLDAARIDFRAPLEGGFDLRLDVGDTDVRLESDRVRHSTHFRQVANDIPGRLSVVLPVDFATPLVSSKVTTLQGNVRAWSSVNGIPNRYPFAGQRNGGLRNFAR